MSGFFYAAADTVPLWTVPVVCILVGVVIMLIVLFWDLTHGGD